MKKLLLLVALAALALPASAAPTLFNFDSLANGAGTTSIGNYMTAQYGSQVCVDDVKIASGDGFTNKYLTTKGDGLSVLWDGNFDIEFKEEGVKCVSFDWYVFQDTIFKDFTFRAYDAQGNLLHEWQTELDRNYCPTGEGGGTYSANFGGQLATRLFFSDNGQHDIGIDNLKVNDCPVVPVPGAILLGSIGCGIVGMLRRKLSA